jgi:hypothetical protein
VGTVVEVKRDPAQSLADVEVSPAAALDRSREVLFVWLPPGAPIATDVPLEPPPAPAQKATTTSKAAGTPKSTAPMKNAPTPNSAPARNAAQAPQP